MTKGGPGLIGDRKSGGGKGGNKMYELVLPVARKREGNCLRIIYPQDGDYEIRNEKTGKKIARGRVCTTHGLGEKKGNGQPNKQT